MESKPTWEQAYATALKLREQQRLEEATYYFVNPLARAPGSLRIITEYTATVKQMARGVDAIEGVRKLEWLEPFLLDRVAHVEPGDIPALLELASAVAQDRESLSPPVESSVGPKEIGLREKLRQYRAGQTDEVIPEAREDIEARIDDLEELREHAVSSAGEAPESELVKQLDVEIERLRTALQFDAMVREGEALIALAKGQTSHTASTYCLQLCETTVRQLVLLKDRLDEVRKGKVDPLLEKLREEGASLSRREIENVWSVFEKESETELNAVRSWSTPSEATPIGACQQQLDRIRNIVQKLQTVLPQLSHAEFSHKASELLAELNKAAMDASIRQSRLYNDWAMAGIRRCLEQGFAQASAISTMLDNTNLMGSIIVQELGPLDTRMLTMEVQRCYQEVFEHLFGKLSNPRSGADFDIPGCKLMVLRDMFNRAKRELSYF